ncbi:MAG: DUF790 family protein [Myxococcales bacterium]|nr:DUF790 family protein [Myxococcota bacterium]MDW8283036.1 DUF790 family protein [Myxococcales bacterium]
MLTAELVRVRVDRRAGQLHVLPLDARLRARALELAAAYLEITRAHLGRTRQELQEALGQVAYAPREQRLAEGLRKLIEDRCRFDVAQGPSPERLRSEVFLRAAAARQQGVFDREQILAEVAASHGLDPAALLRSLYADLREAHVLVDLEPLTAEALVDSYDLAQVQAVLLRAVRVVVEVECARAATYRQLFRWLKFLRLLFRIHPAQDGAYRIELDGPYSLFDSVTRYGLQLALALPALLACDRFCLTAQVRWGKERQPLQLHVQGQGPGADQPEAPLPQEVEALLRAFPALGTPWQVQLAPALLHLPGVGVCVPDLLFERPDGPRIHLEVLGYWSREAVWRRIELVERGLREPVLFCLSSRLRVSQEALPDHLPAALYVYKGTLSPRAVAQRLDELAARRATL